MGTEINTHEAVEWNIWQVEVPNEARITHHRLSNLKSKCGWFVCVLTGNNTFPISNISNTVL